MTEPQRTEPRVQLGCGTLILIAIIVMIFSGDRDERRLRREVQRLHEKIDRLEKKIDAMGAEQPAPVPAPK